MPAYLSKVHLVKDDLVGVANTPESSDKGQNSDDGQANLVLALALASPLGAGLCKLIKLSVGVEGIVSDLLGRSAPLSQAALRRGAASHDGNRP